MLAEAQTEPQIEPQSQRLGSVQRNTKETKVDVSIMLDGTGICESKSGIPFLDHMMDVRCCPAPLIAPFTVLLSLSSFNVSFQGHKRAGAQAALGSASWGCMPKQNPTNIAGAAIGSIQARHRSLPPEVPGPIGAQNCAEQLAGSAQQHVAGLRAPRDRLHCSPSPARVHRPVAAACRSNWRRTGCLM